MTAPLVPGEKVCSAEGLIRGHGTSTDGQIIFSTTYGYPNQVNKFITVAPKYLFKYTPEVGNVVIGRVLQIFSKKWIMDINSRVDSSLALSAILLPGVMQRRKIESDEISMHSFFGINDLVACEVQKVSKSGSVALHTRNERYKRLSNGRLVTVPVFLIPPMKSKFLNGERVELIVGCNGYVWIGAESADAATLTRVNRVANAISEASRLNAPIDFEGIMEEHAGVSG